MVPLTCAIYAESQEERIELKRSLEETQQIDVVERLDDPRKFDFALKTIDLDALFVVLGERGGAALDALEALPKLRPALVFLGPADRSDLILRAMRMGAREYLPLDAKRGELTELVKRLRREPAELGGVEAHGKIIAVMGAKGGVGATVVACQLAGALQAAGRKTCVADLDLRHGEVALHFDLPGSPSLADLGKHPNEVNEARLRSILQSHSSGVSVIAAPQLPEHADRLRAPHVEQALSLLRSRFDCIVLDVPRAWDDPSLRAIDLADLLLLVLSLDLPALTQARRNLELLERLGVPQEKTRLIANRYAKNNGVSVREAFRFLKRMPAYRIPNDYAAVMESLTSGNPLCSRPGKGGIRDAFLELGRRAHAWCGFEVPAERPAKSGMSVMRTWIRKGGH